MNDPPTKYQCPWCNGTGIEPEKRLYFGRLAYAVLRPAKPCAACTRSHRKRTAAEIDRLLAEEAKR